MIPPVQVTITKAVNLGAGIAPVPGLELTFTPQAPEVALVILDADAVFNHAPTAVLTLTVNGAIVAAQAIAKVTDGRVRLGGTWVVPCPADAEVTIAVVGWLVGSGAVGLQAAHSRMTVARFPA